MEAANTAFAVIPARAHSSRFPFKIIAPILEKPMIQYVWENANQAKTLSSVVIATDNEVIAEVIRGFGGKVVLTPELPSGSDRVAFVAKDSNADFIINIQGDEPLLSSQTIDRLVLALRENPLSDLSTLAVKLTDKSQLANPNCVKVVMNKSGEALYFSRAPLQTESDGTFFKHVGIYAYRKNALMKFCKLPQGKLELTEKLEQLRALENGMRIQVVEIENDTIAVDTPEDLKKVESYLRKERKI